MKTLIEIDYQCVRCGHKQEIVFFLSDPMLSVTNCMKCGAGREMTMQEQLRQRVGMFPVGKRRILQGEKHEEIEFVSGGGAVVIDGGLSASRNDGA